MVMKKTALIGHVTIRLAGVDLLSVVHDSDNASI